MVCPDCKSQDNKVIDSREVDEKSIRRRRECLGCGFRFTTYEYVETPQVMVIKKDGNREPFQREKIAKGVWKACEKRPVAAVDVERLIDSVEREVRAMGETEINSRKLGDILMNRLKEFDEIAYIRFASVYRSFADLGDLAKEVSILMADSEKAKQEGN